MQTHNLEHYLEIATRIAVEAGELIKHKRNSALDIDFKGGTELVTNADTACDAFISQALKSHFAEHKILAEESQPNWQNDDFNQQPLWIVDPIDSTVNYAHQHLMVAVSIGLAINNELVLGVVHNPFLNETFTAIKGQGALLNGKTIECSKESNIKRALIATGFPYDKSNLQPLVNRFAAVLNNCADLRRAGSAALDICWTACGRLDGYYESLQLWDFAAAQVIAKEAGCQYGHFIAPKNAELADFECDHILVSNKNLFTELQTLLADANP